MSDVPHQPTAGASSLAIFLEWALAPLRRLFEAAIRDGIRPPATFQGLPPGQFPPIGSLRDDPPGWIGRDTIAFPFESGRTPARRPDDRSAS